MVTGARTDHIAGSSSVLSSKLWLHRLSHNIGNRHQRMHSCSVCMTQCSKLATISKHVIIHKGLQQVASYSYTV